LPQQTDDTEHDENLPEHVKTNKLARFIKTKHSSLTQKTQAAKCVKLNNQA